jgi:hypothetical protein
MRFPGIFTAEMRRASRFVSAVEDADVHQK